MKRPDQIYAARTLGRAVHTITDILDNNVDDWMQLPSYLPITRAGSAMESLSRARDICLDSLVEMLGPEDLESIAAVQKVKGAST